MAIAVLAGSSALDVRGGDQELADAALDVFAQQIWESAILNFFHRQRSDSIKILTGVMEDGALPWDEIAPWSIICYSLGFDAASDNVGGAIEGLVLNAIAVWPEDGFFRRQGQMGIAGLDHKFRIALEGGKDSDGTLHKGNPNLIWRPNAPPHSWANPPATFKGTVNEATAVNGMLRGPLSTRYGSNELSLSGAEPCMMAIMEFSTVYGVVRSTC